MFFIRPVRKNTNDCKNRTLYQPTSSMKVKTLYKMKSRAKAGLWGEGREILVHLISIFSLFHAFLSQYLSGGAYTPPTPSTNRVKYYMFLT